MNAKQEFLDHVGDRKVKAAIIFRGFDNFYEDEGTSQTTLKVGHTTADYEQFLQQLDFSYDEGYGGQELIGTIWYEDGSWSERGEYDGSEWWAYKSCPEITDELKKI